MLAASKVLHITFAWCWRDACTQRHPGEPCFPCCLCGVQTLSMAAELRLPRSMTATQKQHYVEHLMKVLGLSKVGAVRVASTMQAGLARVRTCAQGHQGASACMRAHPTLLDACLNVRRWLIEHDGLAARLLGWIAKSHYLRGNAQLEAAAEITVEKGMSAEVEHSN